jgi:hypothetical protein
MRAKQPDLFLGWPLCVQPAFAELLVPLLLLLRRVHTVLYDDPCFLYRFTHQNQQQTSDCTRQWLQPITRLFCFSYRRVHTVLYEDLVAHPEQVARELLSGCGLGWEQRVLQFQATDRPVHTASMVQVRPAVCGVAFAAFVEFAAPLAL